MSDFFIGEIDSWSERDDRALAEDIREHELADAKHEARLDRTDFALVDEDVRTLTGPGLIAEEKGPNTGGAASMPGRGESVSRRLGGSNPFPVPSCSPGPVSVLSSGLCPACRGNASVPGGDLCSDCLADVLVGDTAA